ncbi:MAG: hypothetical protein KJ072_20510 [Verrucomicrobia bacterium]|nr:hypothetical protein [Verrucomicrobiota bacterium]
MKNSHPKKGLTFGEYVASVYETCGKRRAGAKIQLAIDAHLVEFLGRRRFVVS